MGESTEFAVITQVAAVETRWMVGCYALGSRNFEEIQEKIPENSRVVESGHSRVAPWLWLRFHTAMAPKPYELRNLVRGAAAAARIRRQMEKTGRNPNGHPLWTSVELAACRELAPDFRAIKLRLRRRSLVAIRQKCRELDLSERRNAWTGAEISKLRKLYPSATHEELLATFPHHSFNSIKNAANKRGIFRIKKPYVPTGHPLLDDVRARCYELKLTMPDLDEISRTSTFFKRSSWRTNPRPYRATMRAIVALAGKMKIEWEDDN